MSVTKSSAATNAACDAVVDLIDVGSLSPYGLMVIQTVDSTTITSHRLSNPSFSDAVDGTSQANMIYDGTALVDGTASTFGFYDRDGTFVWGGDITGPGGGGDLELTSISIPVDSTVSITSARYIVP